MKNTAPVTTKYTHSLQPTAHLVLLTMLLSASSVYAASEAIHVTPKSEIDANTALYYAIKNNNIDRAQHAIVKRKADVNKPRCTSYLLPLHLAATEAGPEMVNILLNFKANIDTQDICGATPLMLAAAQCNKEENVQLLILRGANTAITDKKNKTAFDYIKRETVRQTYRNTLATRDALKATEEEKLSSMQKQLIIQGLKKQLIGELTEVIIGMVQIQNDQTIQALNFIKAQL